MKGSLRLLCALFAAALVCAPVAALAAARPKPPARQALPAGDSSIVIRVRDMAGLVNLADDAVGASSPESKGMVRSTIEQQYGGLSWLDTRRSVVLIVNPDVLDGKAGDAPLLVGLVPFVKKNEQFRQNFNATAGRDYYLFTYPAGGVVKKGMAARLFAASKEPCTDMLAVDIPMSMLVDKLMAADDGGLQDSIRKEAEKHPDKDGGLSADQLAGLATGFVESLRDVKTLTVGMDSDDGVFSLHFTALPVPGTTLAEALAKPPGPESLLSGYKPEGAMTFRTRAMDTSLFTRAFSAVYSKAGFDISGMEALRKHFTGESAVGLSFTGDAPRIEGMTGLVSDGESVEEIVDQWIAYNAKLMASMKGESAPPAPARSETTTVSGIKVTGISWKIPVEKDRSVDFSLRVAVKGRILLLAPDDTRMAALLARADGVKPSPASGPCFQGQMDIGDMMRGAASGAAHPEDDLKVPEGHPRLDFSGDVGGGRADYRVSFRTSEFKEFFAKLSAASDAAKKPGKGASGGPGWSDIEEKGAEDEAVEPGPRPEKPNPEAAALLEKGNLAVLYGSPAQAIRYFTQALEKDPESPDVHFALGMAYGETAQFNKAFYHVNKAVELDPENPEYLYGRARLHLLSGNEDEARKGFADAAQKGSEDARRFLDRMGQKK